MKFKNQFQKLVSVDCADDGQMMHHRFKSLAVRIVCIVFFSKFYTKGASGNPASRVFLVRKGSNSIKLVVFGWVFQY